MDPLATDRADRGSQTHRFEAVGEQFDTTLHRISRWIGYGLLCAVYIGLADYLFA